MSLSDAERRRQERRQRILANPEERLKKILGSNSNFERTPLTRLTAETNWHEDTNRESSVHHNDDGDEGEEGREIGKGQTLSKSLRSNNMSKEETPEESMTFRQNPTPPLDSGKFIFQEEENIKIPTRYHHVLLCLLSLILATFGGAYFLMYFVIYEFAIFVLNGYSFSSFYSTKNSSLLTLGILFGVSEVHRNRFQKLTFIINWLSVDLTIFISSALLVALLYKLVV